MNKYFILLCLLIYLFGCSQNNITHYKNEHTTIKLGEKKNIVDAKLGNPIKCEKNEDNTFTTVYTLKNNEYIKNKKMYKKVIILYDSNLYVTNFILD